MNTEPHPIFAPEVDPPPIKPTGTTVPNNLFDWLGESTTIIGRWAESAFDSGLI